jgi:Tir chaperone protein (CesT) family
MLLQSCNDLMRALGADVGIPDLALDEAHCSTLAFDSVVVNFELDESSEQLFLYASLGPMPAAGSRVYEQLLEGNLLWKDTGGATLSLDREGGRVILHQGLPAERLSEVDFKAAVEQFVNVAEAWTQRVSEGAAQPRDEAGAPPPPARLNPEQLV